MTTGKGNTTSQNFLKLLYQAVAWANVADDASASPLTNIYYALHTADPLATGNQTSSEAGYGSYARQAVARTAGGHSITGQAISPAATVSFPQSTGTPSETETYFSTGSAVSGATAIFHWGPISPTITMNAAGITPQLTTSTTISES